MKQYITKKQWDELDNKEKDKFMIYLYPQDKGMNKYWNITHSNLQFKFTPINIGDMIKFLGDDWAWDFVEEGSYDSRAEFCIKNKDLCDELWEAVKNELLKKL